MLALVALWGVPALLRTHGEFLQVGLGHHVVGRSFGTMQGHGGNSILAALLFLPFYFFTVFLHFRAVVVEASVAYPSPLEEARCA